MKYLVSLVGSAAMVAAHGYVDNATIGGEFYKFYQPYTDPYTNPKPDRISRPIQGNGPVQDVAISDIQCGGYAAGGVKGSSPAALHAKAAAGSAVTLHWTLWPDSHVGPTITYMAKCPDAGCQNYMPESNAVWFKIQENGRDGTSSTWGATPLMKAGNAGVTYTIPECLASGYYLVRHEIIALHSAYQYPGAQFYPSCHQLQVTGSGSTVPSGLVSFPGAYAASDPGITFDAYKANAYTIPGPSLFSCSGSSSPSPSGAKSVSSSTTTQATTLATATKASSAAAASSSSVTAVVNAATSTTSSSYAAQTTGTEEPDDECGAEETITATITSSSASATPSASAGDDDDDDESCDSEGDTVSTATTRAASSAPTGSSSSGGGDDDECDAEDAKPTATSSAAATATSSASDDDGDDECDAEEKESVGRRFSGRFAPRY